jgi:hypothetical protein
MCEEKLSRAPVAEEALVSVDEREQRSALKRYYEQ